MDKYLTTIAVDPIKAKLKYELLNAARRLVEEGKGQSHYAKLERRGGVWWVNMYER